MRQPAQRADRLHHTRPGAAPGQRRHRHAAPAGALGHRPAPDLLHQFLLGAAARARYRRPAGDAYRAAGQPAHRDTGQRLPRDAAVHPLRCLPEPLPYLRRRRRARLRLGVPRADGLDTHPAADLTRAEQGPAQRLHQLRPLRRGLPGRYSAAGAAAQPAPRRDPAEAVTSALAPGAQAPRLGGAPSYALPHTDGAGHFRHVPAGTAQGRLRAAADGGGLDQPAGLPRAPG